MRSYSSRLARIHERRSRQQIFFFFAASIVIIIAIIMVGIPALLNLAGTISQFRRGPVAVTTDNSPIPTTPVFSQDLIATTSANIKIRGAADPKTTVEITQNDRVLGTVITQDDGSFTYDVSLEKNDNIFTGVAVSETGKKSTVSLPYDVKYLTAQPKLDITSPKDGDKIGSNQTTVSGKTDPGDSITINGRYVIVASDGAFSYPLNLNSGDNKIEIFSVDPAGNKTTKDMTVTRQ